MALLWQPKVSYGFVDFHHGTCLAFQASSLLLPPFSIYKQKSNTILNKDQVCTAMFASPLNFFKVEEASV